MSNNLRIDLPTPPSEWDRFRIAEKFAVRSGSTPLRNLMERYYHNGHVPWVKTLDLNEGHIYSTQEHITLAAVRESSCEILPLNTVLVAMYGGWLQIGRTAILGIAAATNQAICGLTPIDLTIDPNYLLRFLQAYRFRWKALAGSTRKDPNITKNDILHFEFAAPPLPQQRKIAWILTTVDNLIEKTEALIAKYQAIKQGLMHDLFTRGVDEHGHLRPPYEEAPELYKQSELGWIPKEWEVQSIATLAVRVGSGITPTGGSEVYLSEGVIFIRSQNVTFIGLDLSDVAYIDFKMHHLMSGSEVFAFDILLNITGASIGRCCYVPSGLGLANSNQHVCCIRLPEANEPDAKFLSSVLASPIGQNQIFRLNAGGNREGLNYQQLRSFIVPWPPAEGRKRISDRLDAIENLIANEKRSLRKFAQQKTGLMQDLLTGKVRVKVDEADEVPAHA